LDDVHNSLDATETDVLTGRLHDIAGDAWIPRVLLAASAADPDPWQPLLTALRDGPPRSATAAIVTGLPEHAIEDCPRLVLENDGTLRIPNLGLTVRAHQLRADEAADMAAIIALAASGNTQPAPPSRGDQPWDQYADAVGAPRPEITVTQTRSRPDDDAGAVPRHEKPSVPPDTAVEIENADPTLDADLAVWHDPNAEVVKLRLLGPPLVTGAAGSLPELKPREDFHTEVLTYLALHKAVTSVQLGAALWPNSTESTTKTTARQAISRVRLWLGRQPATGAEYIPRVGSGNLAGLYSAHGLLIDGELFRRLRLRGTARGLGNGGVADLLNALRLVDGRPLDHARIPPRRSRGSTICNEAYSWLIDFPIDHEYEVMIADTANTAGQFLLDDGDLEQASWAARVAIRAGDQSGAPLLILLQVAEKRGNQAEAKEYLRQIMTIYDADVEEDLPPRTYEIIRRLDWPRAG
jgi:hypothetical protein